MFVSVLCAIAPSKKQAKCLSIAESIASHSGALGGNEKERSTTRHKHVDEILNHHVDQKSDTKEHTCSIYRKFYNRQIYAGRSQDSEQCSEGN